MDTDTLIAKSKSSLRAGDFEEALKYAEEAVRVSAGSPAAQLRRVVCLFRLKRAGEAKSLAQFIGKGQEADTWREILDNNSIVSIEVPRIPPAHPSLPQAKAPASVQQPQGPRVDFFQSQTTANIIVYRKGLPEDTQVLIHQDELQIKADDFSWSTKLANKVKVPESSYDITKFKVEFKLHKEETGQWESYNGPLVSTSKSTAAATISEKPVKSTNRTLSYSKWDSLEDSDEGEEDKDPMQFFQNLYKNSSPEVQKAMAKSYVESNGTALSTNWSEVSKKKVDVHPPQSMEAKKY